MSLFSKSVPVREAWFIADREAGAMHDYRQSKTGPTHWYPISQDTMK